MPDLYNYSVWQRMPISSSWTSNGTSLPETGSWTVSADSVTIGSQDYYTYSDSPAYSWEIDEKLRQWLKEYVRSEAFGENVAKDPEENDIIGLLEE